MARSAFGDMVRSLLAERGWSQNELARRSLYDRGHLSKVLNGNKPSRKMAEIFDELLGAGGQLAALVPPSRSETAARPRPPSTLAEQVAVLSGEIRDLRAEVGTLVQAVMFALLADGDDRPNPELVSTRRAERE